MGRAQRSDYLYPGQALPMARGWGERTLPSCSVLVWCVHAYPLHCPSWGTRLPDPARHLWAVGVSQWVLGVGWSWHMPRGKGAVSAGGCGVGEGVPLAITEGEAGVVFGRWEKAQVCRRNSCGLNRVMEWGGKEAWGL